jgi:hypothetical protein
MPYGDEKSKLEPPGTSDTCDTDAQRDPQPFSALSTVLRGLSKADSAAVPACSSPLRNGWKDGIQEHPESLSAVV